MQVSSETSLASDRIVAVGLLTQREVEMLGHGFTRLWPVDETPFFTELISAIDEADRELARARDQGDHPVAGGGRH